MAIKIVIDTDIGTDIDDAYALAFAGKSPEFELLAVTTVSGHPIERAKLARQVLAVAGQPHVTVAAGWSLPLYSLSPRGRKAYLEAGLTYMDLAAEVRTPYRLGAAVTKILDAVDRHAGEVSLVTLGPLTNIAAAITADPDLPHKVKCIAMMGGDLDLKRHEHNVRMDPEAADLVFCCGARMFLATWDVSGQLVLFPEQLEVLRAGGGALSSLLLRCTDLWWPHRGAKPGPVLFDIAPFLWLLEPDWFETIRTPLRAETRNPVLRGATYKDTEGASPIDVTTRFVNPEKARDFVLKRLTGR
jgi:purine nucleosidase